MIEHFLSINRIPYRSRGTNVGRDSIAIPCLWHDDVSAHLNINIHDMFFHCWVCDEKGSKYKLKRKFQELGYNCDSLTFSDYYYTAQHKVESKLPVDFIQKIPDSSLVWEWIAGKPNKLLDPYRDRWFDVDKIKLLDVYNGINDWAGYFVFKVDDCYIGRLYNPKIKGDKWKKHGTITKLFMADYCKEHTGIGYITEGVFDCLRFPIGEAVALLTNNTNLDGIYKIHEAFAKTKEICIALDTDVKQRNIDFIKNNLETLGHKVTQFNLNGKYKDIDNYCILNNIQEYAKIVKFV